jgi:ribosomal protein S28E/S33
MGVRGVVDDEIGVHGEAMKVKLRALEEETAKYIGE